MSLYHEQLKDKRWIAVRESIKARDGHKCVDCGAADVPLEVHHGFYYPHWTRTPPWSYPPESLWTLCRSCHADKENETLAVMKQFGMTDPRLWKIVFAIVSEVRRCNPERLLEMQGTADVLRELTLGHDVDQLPFMCCRDEFGRVFQYVFA